MCGLSQTDCLGKSSSPGQRALQARRLRINRPPGAPRCRATCSRRSTSRHLFVESCRFLPQRRLTFTAICQCPRHIPASSPFVLAKLPGHVVRCQRAEIMRGSSGACRRAEPAGPKSTTALFAEALCLLIKPTEGSFLVSFSAACDYWCWLTPPRHAHFPALPVASLSPLFLDSLQPLFSAARHGRTSRSPLLCVFQKGPRGATSSLTSTLQRGEEKV